MIGLSFTFSLKRQELYDRLLVGGDDFAIFNFQAGHFRGEL